jgi:hypothetical protein
MYKYEKKNALTLSKYRRIVKNSLEHYKKNTYHILFLIKRLQLPKELINYIQQFTCYNSDFYKNDKIILYKTINKSDLHNDMIKYVYHPKRIKEWMFDDL